MTKAQVPLDSKLLWSIDEVAQVLGVSRRTLDNWRKRPDFPAPAPTPGNFAKFRPDDIRAWARGEPVAA